jgi:hypothetical protein
MDNQASVDPAWAIIEELDPTGLHRLLGDFWNHPQVFTQEIHLLVWMLDATGKSIGSWEQEQIADIHQRTGANVGSEQYGAEYEDIETIAEQQRELAYNLFFTGLMDAVARRFTKIAWQIGDMIRYLPQGADKDDPRLLITDLLKWSGYAVELDLKKITPLDTSGGRLRAARDARNLLVHPKKPVFETSEFSKDQRRVQTHMPEMLSEDGCIQANADRIRQVAEDAKALMQKVVNKHEHGWLMLLHDSLADSNHLKL